MSKESHICNVAAVQMVSSDSVESNLEIMSEQVKLAASKGAKLVVLPEYFAFMGTSETEKLRWAELDHRDSRDNAQEIQSALSQVAKKNDVWQSIYQFRFFSVAKRFHSTNKKAWS